jgi:iron complex outermembrane receptor protein
MPLLIQETPASIGIVTKKIIEDQNATVLSEALTNISSVNVQSNLGTHDYFLIRGFESTSGGLILIDSANEPDVSQFKFYGYGFYDLYNINQVEVLKGPAAFLYGGNTLSGAINMIRKQPVFQNFAQVSGIYGRYNYYRTTFDGGATILNKKIAMRINGLWQDFDQYRDEKHNYSVAVNPAVTWNISQKHSVTANFEHVTSKVTPDIGIPLYVPDEKWQLPDMPTTISYQTSFDMIDQEIDRFRLDYRGIIGNRITIREKFYFTNLEGGAKLTLVHVPHMDASTRWVLERHMYSFQESQQSFGNQIEALISFKTGMVRHNVLAGLEISRLKNFSSRAVSIIEDTLLFSPGVSETNFDQLITLIQIKTDASSSVVAPYFVAHTSLSKKLQFFLGARYDIINLKSDRLNQPFDYTARSLTSRPMPISENHKQFSPMFGIVFKDSESLWIYANAGKSFAQGLRVIDRPENSTQYEIGYKYKSQSGRLWNSVAIYQLKKENMTIPLQGPLQGGAHAPDGGQRSRGLEFELITQPLDNLYTFFTYSYTEAELLKYSALTLDHYLKQKLADFSGNMPSFIPAHILNIWITKEFINGMGFGFGMRYISNQYVHVDNNFELDEYVTFDASLFYKFTKGGWHINVKNLTNTQYFTRGLGPYSLIPAGLSSLYVSVYFAL